MNGVAGFSIAVWFRMVGRSFVLVAPQMPYFKLAFWLIITLCTIAFLAKQKKK